MMDAKKYRPGYFPPRENEYRWVKKDHIEQAPAWCSVDLRDGNQALIVPMDLEEKLEFYKMLLEIGFKEIEVGFPAASQTEYEFLRTIIDHDMIPEDVTIQVLTQCRDHIIRKTFEAVKGAPRAVIHFYNSTSLAQREQVFRKSKEEIKQIAIEGARLVKKLSREYEGNFLFEYSPESFTGTEPDFALDVCNAVLDIMQPTPEQPMIINLPVTVEMSMPHIYANQIEYCSDRLKYRDAVILSTHPHNDRGTGVADTELALLAGAQRVECCLFGNGERTGNVDAVTLAMNMYTHGVDPKLDFSNMPSIVERYERLTRMHVSPRQPYAGQLVFAAFSGSHQDAIAKGMKHREENDIFQWNVPYIPLDPHDVSRTYDSDVIRINSQSGKGGIGYILETSYGYALPAKMREHFGYTVKDISDHAHKELSAEEVYEIFEKTYVNIERPVYVREAHFRQGPMTEASVTALIGGHRHELIAKGNGRLDAVCSALKSCLDADFTLQSYHEHSLDQGSHSRAAGYVGLQWADGRFTWGAGVDTDIIRASIKALTSAINNGLREGE
ncbi:2-isopropylmalate synthase [Erysipelotrichaceae bacterium OPF54]|nr:2-isopropylmalate synthase [Erysipelotrichaceae bacterium OPF54]HAM30221.1 2-isopropylmalate synthase [Erysipelotrichaceae bacterium]